jgi:hypothetical protein
VLFPALFVDSLEGPSSTELPLDVVEFVLNLQLDYKVVQEGFVFPSGFLVR